MNVNGIIIVDSVVYKPGDKDYNAKKTIKEERELEKRQAANSTTITTSVSPGRYTTGPSNIHRLRDTYSTNQSNEPQKITVRLMLEEGRPTNEDVSCWNGRCCKSLEKYNVKNHLKIILTALLIATVFAGLSYVFSGGNLNGREFAALAVGGACQLLAFGYALKKLDDVYKPQNPSVSNCSKAWKTALIIAVAFLAIAGTLALQGTINGDAFTAGSIFTAAIPKALTLTITALACFALMDLTQSKKSKYLKMLAVILVAGLAIASVGGIYNYAATGLKMPVQDFFKNLLLHAVETATAAALLHCIMDSRKVIAYANEERQQEQQLQQQRQQQQ